MGRHPIISTSLEKPCRWLLLEIEYATYRAAYVEIYKKARILQLVNVRSPYKFANISYRF